MLPVSNSKWQMYRTGRFDSQILFNELYKRYNSRMISSTKISLRWYKYEGPGNHEGCTSWGTPITYKHMHLRTCNVWINALIEWIFLEVLYLSSIFQWRKDPIIVNAPIVGEQGPFNWGISWDEPFSITLAFKYVIQENQITIASES